MPDPVSKDGWMSVARARLQEARAIYEGGDNHVGCAYLSGYGVECALKAYICSQGKKPWGHDLVTLSHQAGIQRNAFKASAWFLSSWAVDWRYLEHDGELPDTISNCLNAAGQLHGYISKVIMRKERRKLRRGK